MQIKTHEFRGKPATTAEVSRSLHEKALGHMAAHGLANTAANYREACSAVLREDKQLAQMYTLCRVADGPEMKAHNADAGKRSAGKEVDAKVREHMKRTGANDYAGAMRDVLANPVNRELLNSYAGVSS